MSTNYEKIINPTLLDVARKRTKCVSYSFGYTYLNDAGLFAPQYNNEDPYEDAIKAEVEWLNKCE